MEVWSRIGIHKMRSLHLWNRLLSSSHHINNIRWYQSYTPSITTSKRYLTTNPSASHDQKPTPSVSIDKKEVKKFDELASQWWDVNGHAKMLHRMNPTRIAYIRSGIEVHLLSHSNSNSHPKRQEKGQQTDAETDMKGFQGGNGQGTRIKLPLDGVSILDIGCGGGLVSEPLARLGAQVLGVDGSSQGVYVATEHAKLDPMVQGRVEYRQATAEELVSERKQFDVVCALEIIEHVKNPKEFLKDCSSLVRPGGLLFLSTMNRTVKSYMIAVLGAEYVARVLPVGTHQWTRFVRPEELSTVLESFGMKSEEVVGIVYDLFTRSFKYSQDHSVNYIFMASKKA
mmetsp:Transcript_12109/g.20680  ORF Transcript_12109/g.20680 Transcript_12109/m.20680 type:complete len:341 (-) Transcript_12109:50-1072(-)